MSCIHFDICIVLQKALKPGDTFCTKKFPLCFISHSIYIELTEISHSYKETRQRNMSFYCASTYNCIIYGIIEPLFHFTFRDSFILFSPWSLGTEQNWALECDSHSRLMYLAVMFLDWYVFWRAVVGIWHGSDATRMGTRIGPHLSDKSQSVGWRGHTTDRTISHANRQHF